MPRLAVALLHLGNLIPILDVGNVHIVDRYDRVLWQVILAARPGPKEELTWTRQSAILERDHLFEPRLIREQTIRWLITPAGGVELRNAG